MNFLILGITYSYNLLAQHSAMETILARIMPGVGTYILNAAVWSPQAIHISCLSLDPVSPLSSLKEAEAFGIWHWQKLCWTQAHCSGTTFLPNISFCVEHLRTWWGRAGELEPIPKDPSLFDFPCPTIPGRSSADWRILFCFLQDQEGFLTIHFSPSNDSFAATFGRVQDLWTFHSKLVFYSGTCHAAFCPADYFMFHMVLCSSLIA